MTKHEKSACDLVAEALNRAGIPSDDGTPWTYEMVEAIWNGPTGQMMRAILEEEDKSKLH